MTVISAPAGYGKTTLLSGWAEQSKRRVAWVALDSGDDEPTRFWACFTAAIRELCPDVGEAAWGLARLAGGFGRESIVALGDEIAGLGQDLVVIIDDYHLIEDRAIHADVSFLIEHMPRGLHLVFSSRSIPPLPLARLRARGWLSEVAAVDLAFTLRETEAFLVAAGLPEPSDDQLALLQERTQGWIVALWLATLAIKEKPDRISIGDGLRISERLTADYLTEEVLRLQSDTVRDFLLRTSVLDCFSADLCDFVLEDEGRDSASLLATIERGNLFLVPTDEPHTWFRYHPVFAELLRSELQHAEPEAATQLLARASLWHEAQADYAPAIAYAHAASDIPRAAMLVEDSRHTLLARGDLADLLEFTRKLPAELFEIRVGLALARAWALVPTGRFSEVSAVLETASRLATTAADLEVGEREALFGEVEAVRAVMGIFGHDWGAIRHHSEAAIALLPAEYGFLHTLMQLCLGWALQVECCHREARESITKTFDSGQECIHALLHSLAQDALARNAVSEGRLREAAGHLREALGLACSLSGDELPLAGPIHVLLGSILYEWNELEEAETHLRLGLQLSEHWRDYDSYQQGHYLLGSLLHTTGRLEEAVECLDDVLNPSEVDAGLSHEVEATGLTPLIMPTALISPLSLPCAQLWHKLSRRSVKELAAQFADQVWEEACRMSALPEELLVSLQWVVTIRLIQGDAGEAEKVIERILPECEARHLDRRVLELLVSRAMIHWSTFQTRPALSALERALALAEPEGYVRLFADQGPEMHQLLSLAAGRGIKPAYIARLLEAFVMTDSSEPLPRNRNSGLLSNRELEVLRLAANGFATDEIAKSLVLSVCTVRGHFRSIHAKVGASKRREAIRRARELGLLS